MEGDAENGKFKQCSNYYRGIRNPDPVPCGQSEGACRFRLRKPASHPLAFGALFALMFDIDFFALMGYSSQLPIIAKVITGLILSSGSTGVHELVAKLRESRVDS